MRVRIHHGADQVGGNCIEVQSQGLSLLLDLGLPLDAEARLPEIAGLIRPDPNLLGVVLSHPHLDHYGLLPQVRTDLPVWLGEGAIRLLDAAAPFATGSRLPQRLTGYRDRTPFQVGPFSIRPYLMDHSAYDAYGLLVEADGQRLFYSGDFRGHGRKARAFERFLAAPPRDVNLLLMEGTTLSRDDVPASERDVEVRATELIGATPGLALVCFSAQNIDRFVSFFRATVRSGRRLIVDAYLANLISSLGVASLPDPQKHPALRVFLPAAQRRAILRESRFDLIEPYRARRIYPDEIGAHPHRFAMMFRASMATDLARVPLAGASLIYSLWPGYLERDRLDLRVWAKTRGVDFHIVHASGHAGTADLKRMAEAIQPTCLTPIHTTRPDAYQALYPHIRQTRNGEWLELNDEN